MKTSACGRTYRASSALLPLGLGWTFTCAVWLTADTDLLAQDGLRLREQVITKAVKFGYQLLAVDLNRDGRDEIVSGFRGKGFQLSTYQATDAKGEAWRKQVLDDGGIAAADCVIDDFTGDGQRDIACIGASTGNLKLYENVGR